MINYGTIIVTQTATGSDPKGEKIIINYGTNILTQTVTGKDQNETTKHYVVKSEFGNTVDIITHNTLTMREKYGHVEIFGYCTTIYSKLLADTDTWEDFFCAIILKYMIDNGLLEQNKDGYLFLK